jgi:hypothetical protein
MTKARSALCEFRQLDATVIGGRPASPIKYFTCVQHSERTQSISGSVECLRFHDRAKRHSVSGTRLGCGRKDSTLSCYWNRPLMILAVFGELLLNYFQSVQWNLMRLWHAGCNRASDGTLSTSRSTRRHSVKRTTWRDQAADGRRDGGPPPQSWPVQFGARPAAWPGTGVSKSNIGRRLASNESRAAASPPPPLW